MRPDLEVIAGLVPHGARVLDLGCGDGQLLQTLIQQRGCSGTGVENDPVSLIAAIRRGVSVMEVDIDDEDPAGLAEFADSTYDLVIVSQTLQTTRRPDRVLDHVQRIAGRGIISVPNFGYWKHRFQLLVGGRMPVSSAIPHPWYDTPNIHLSSLRDVETLIAERGFEVQEQVTLGRDGFAIRTPVPNVVASGAVYLLG